MFKPCLRTASRIELLERSVIELEIERLIAVLDRFDGDPDFEDNGDYESEPDDEDGGDDEPCLGWCTLPGGGVMFGATDDLEEEWRYRCYRKLLRKAAGLGLSTEKQRETALFAAFREVGVPLQTVHGEEK